MRNATAKRKAPLEDRAPEAEPLDDEELDDAIADASLEEMAAEEVASDEEEVAVADAADGLVSRGATGHADELTRAGDDAAGELAMTVVPIRSSEFVCTRCNMAKHKAQLVDRRSVLCRDCA